MSDVNKVIEDATEILKNNWHKGDMIGPDGESFCMAGALCMASGAKVVQHHFDAADMDHNLYSEALGRVGDTVRSETKHYSVPSFNDAGETSLEDVLLIMKKAAHDS
jgi:hypothetical protein